MSASKQFVTMIDDSNSMYLSFEDTMSETNPISTEDTNLSYKSIAACGLTALSDAESEREDSKGNTTLEPQNFGDVQSSELISALEPLQIQPIQLCNDFKSSTPSKLDENTLRKQEILKTKLAIDLKGVFENWVTEFDRSMKKHADNADADDADDENKENKPNHQACNDDSLPSFSSATIMKIQMENNSKNHQNNNNNNNNNSSPPPVEVKKKRTKKSSTTKTNHSQSKGKNVSQNPTKKKVKMHSIVRKSLCEPNIMADNNMGGANGYCCLETNQPVSLLDCEWAVFDDLGEGKYLRTMSEQASGMMQMQGGVQVEEVKSVEKPIVLHPDSSRNLMVKPNNNKKADVIARRQFLPINQGYPPQAQQQPPVTDVLKNNSLNRKVSRKSNYAAAVASNKNLPSRRKSTMVLHKKLASPLPTAPQNQRFSRSTKTSSSDVLMSKSRATGGGYGGGVASDKYSSNYITGYGRKTMYGSSKAETPYNCAECGTYYNVKALYDAHRNTHRRNTSPEPQRTITPTNHAYRHRCKYCDKGFALERALHIHLLEYCPKIPAIERRKLDFKEMDHVAKAATPHFSCGQTASTKKSEKDPLAHLPVKKYGATTIDGSGKKKKPDEGVKTDVQKSSEKKTKELTTLMAPPLTTKVKKATEHTGVHRTPSKEIPCLSCNQTFKSLIDYTNHVMTEHQSLNSPKNES